MSFRATKVSIVHQWLDAEGGKIDKAFGEQPGSASSSANPQPDFREAESRAAIEQEESQQLRAALIQYRQLDVDPRLDLDVDNCTWEDVFRCMTRAQTDYNHKAKKWQGVAHRLLRKAGDYADHVDPWLKLIPPEYGMGIIGAGISIIFRLAHTASKNREKILNAFEEVPIIVASSKAKMKAFPGNQVLQSCSEKLNLAIIVAVSKLKVRKVQYFWFKSKLGESTLDDVLESLKQQTDELKRLVQDFVDEAIGEIQRTTRDIKKDTSDIKNDTSELKTAASDIQESMSALEGQVRRLADNDHTTRLNIYLQKVEESNVSRSSLELVLNEVMDALQRKEQEKQNLLVEIQRIRALSPIPGLMTADQLLFAIGASTLIQQSTEDIDKILRFKSSVHPIAEGEAASLLGTDKFFDWIQPSRSDILLVDGAGAAVEFVDHVERVSAKSVLCA
ncbi:hypothetical protein FALBO_10931 [Fusarium albosuccineum]|uniref:Uncharacterized protein n=1 Tax=Fusarium albosuccineum TaxID=1237068 RepID=A0A8H4L4Q9_9HYPO|nr:hypothetical protein FALBO_10931 [Fusarium albosuccineum]